LLGCASGDASKKYCPKKVYNWPVNTYWTSLVDQTVKDSPAMLETWLQSLGWEDLLEEGMATHSSILA